MNRLFNWLTGIGLGATAMYFWDPDLGRRRRALVRDQVNRWINNLNRAMDVTVRDMENRLYGTYAEIRSRVAGGDVSDEVLVDRVRSKLGRYVSHSSAIEVTAHDGAIVLNGPVLADEVDALLCAVECVPGVADVENRLDVHDSPGNVSDLQGGTKPGGEPAEWMQANWSPTMRFAAGTLGAALMANCLTRRTPLGVLLGPIGFGLMVKSLMNQSRGGKTPDSRGGSREGHRTQSVRQDRQQDAADAAIDEACEESFPASDPPSYTSSTVSRTNR